MLENVVIGIIAGLVTTGLVFLIQNVFKTKFQPWYEERVYKDTRIEGIWSADYKVENVEEIVSEQIELYRTAHNVTGYLTVLSGPDKGEQYWLYGEFRNLILTCDYCSVRSDALDRGTYCLVLRENGRLLEGQSTYLVDERNKIESNSITWRKKWA